MGNHDHEYIIINQIMFQFRYQLVQYFETENYEF